MINSSLRVGIADYKVAKAPNSLITVGLGSCVGTFIYDERSGVGGLSHIMLPDSSLYMGSLALNPAKYADTALELMVKELKRKAPYGRFKAKIAGGANMFDFNKTLKNGNVGKRNVEAVEAELSRLHIPLIAENVGGNSGRTMRVNLETFEATISIVHHDSIIL